MYSRRFFLILSPIFIAAILFPAAGLSQTDPSNKRAASVNESSADTQGSPQKLYEAISGYMNGMKGKNVEARPIDRDQSKWRGPSRSSLQSGSEPVSQENEEALIRSRMEDGQWRMAIVAIKRALANTSESSDPKRAARLRKLLQIATDHLAKPSSGTRIDSDRFRNSLGLSMVLIKPGSFMMGCSDAEARRVQSQWAISNELMEAERPQHEVSITQPFLMGQYEVTVGQFKQFVSDTGYVTAAERRGWGWVYNPKKKKWTKQRSASWRNPGYEVWDDQPVTMVSHEDAEAFCQWLSQLDGRDYFLPTEAQWEYAARGGLRSKRFPWGGEYPDSRKLNLADRRSGIPWADRTIDDGYARMAGVGGFRPNGYWLYDMAGNAWEMCSDNYSEDAYEKRDQSVTKDPTGPRRGKTRVVRGGNWAFGAGIARNSFRFGVAPTLTTDLQGFRIAAAVTDAQSRAKEKKNELSPEEIIKREGIQRLLTRIKKLVAQGRRLEAKRIAESVSRLDPDETDTMDEPEEFISEVLKSLIDVTEEEELPSFMNSLSMKMVQIPSGSFVMGSSEADIAWAMTTLSGGSPVSLEHEYPFHKVRISRPFYMSATEVTVGQFKQFVRETGYVTDAEDVGGGQVFDTEDSRFIKKQGAIWKSPGWKVSDAQPVTMVSYYDALAFCEWLSAKEKLPYKLPTEAQWEYAARGGKPMKQFPWGDDLPDGAKANYADSNTDFQWRDRNADDGYRHVAPVGSYEPNGFGLFDMAGNILEWTRDYYSRDYYRYSPEVDPQGPGHGEYFVMRGGEWTFGALNLRCAFRGWSRPDLSFFNSGFRVVIDLSAPLKPFHFSSDFLTQDWAPAQEHREVARAVALNSRRTSLNQEQTGISQEVEGPEITGEPLKGVRVLGFSPKSDARDAGFAIGDVIMEYDGVKELTPERFIALTGRTSGSRGKIGVVVARDGFKYDLRADPGFLGVIVTETVVMGPLKTPPKKRRRKRNPRDKGGKESLNWT